MLQCRLPSGRMLILITPPTPDPLHCSTNVQWAPVHGLCKAIPHGGVALEGRVLRVRRETDCQTNASRANHASFANTRRIHSTTLHAVVRLH